MAKQKMRPVEADVDWTYDVDPKTGRLVKKMVSKPRTRPAPSPLKGIPGLPSPLTRAAEDMASEAEPYRITPEGRMIGGPGALDALSGVDLPFRAAGEAAYEATGSPLAATAAYVLPGAVSPRQVASGARKALRGAARVLDPRNLAVGIEREATDLAFGPRPQGVLREGAETARSLLDQLKERAGAYGDVMSPAMYAVKPRGGNWIEPNLKKHHIQQDLLDLPQEVQDEIMDTASERASVLGLDPESDEFMDTSMDIAYRMAEERLAQPGMVPRNDWVERNLKKWIKTSLGTEETDALARELGMDAPTPETGRNIFDSVIDVSTLGERLLRGWPASGPRARKQAIPDWAAKQAETPEGLASPLYGLWEDQGLDELLDPLMDYVSTVPPEKLKSISVPDMFRKSKAWHDELAKRQSEQMLTAGNLKSLREYPEGMKWVQIVEPEGLPEGTRIDWDRGGPGSGRRKKALYGPGDQYWSESSTGEIPMGFTDEDVMKSYRRMMLAQGLNAEGQMMGHCVGRYCDEVQKMGHQIMSLRDKSGRPHVTVETRPTARSDLIEKEGLRGIGFQNAFDEKHGDGAFDRLMTHINEGQDVNEGGNLLTDPEARDMRNSVEDMWDISHWLRGNRPDLVDPSWYTQNIAQIKGKQNAAPIEQYLPFVQDLIRNPTGTPWGRVGDLKNTGMVRVTDRSGKSHYVTPEQASQFLQPDQLVPGKKHAAGIQPGGDYTFEQLDIPDEHEFAGGGKVASIAKEGAEIARSLLAKLKEKAGAFGDVLDPQMYAVKPRGGNWVEPNSALANLKGFEPDLREKLQGIPDPSGKYEDLHQRVQAERSGNGDYDYYATKLLEELGMGDPTHKYFDKNLARWIKTSMGTEETDALAKELGIDFPPAPGGGFVRQGGPADITQDANPFDRAVRTRTAADFRMDRYGATQPGQQNEWMNKLPSDAPIYSIRENQLPEIFHQMKDYMGTLPPEKLPNISVPDMLRKSKQWHDEIARRRTEDAIKAGTQKTLREYPEGYSWVELTKPESLPPDWQLPPGFSLNPMESQPGKYQITAKSYKDAADLGGPLIDDSPEAAKLKLYQRRMLRQGLEAESEMMGHCVGKDPSYCKAVMEGRNRILSLRDKEGRPHATLQLESPKVSPTYRDKVKALKDMSFEEVSQLPHAYGRAPAIDRALEQHAEMVAQGASPEDIATRWKWNLTGMTREPFLYHEDLPYLAQRVDFLPSIKQIKGKENKALIDKYHSFAQDLINNPLEEYGGWGEIREPENAGLLDPRQMTRGELGTILLPAGEKRKPSEWGSWHDELQGFMAQDPEMPRLMTPDQLRAWYLRKGKGFAEGGSVEAEMDPGAVSFLAEFLHQREAA